MQSIISIVHLNDNKTIRYFVYTNYGFIMYTQSQDDNIQVLLDLVVLRRGVLSRHVRTAISAINNSKALLSQQLRSILTAINAGCHRSTVTTILDKNLPPTPDLPVDNIDG